LKTYEGAEGAGAAAGQYRVVVYQVTVTEGVAAPDGQEGGGQSTDSVAPKDQIPAIYSNAAQSPIVQEIKAGDNDVKVELVASSNVNKGA
jgi:hypothetical protein